MNSELLGSGRVQVHLSEHDSISYQILLSRLYYISVKQRKLNQNNQPSQPESASLSDPIAMIKMKMEPGHYQKSHVYLIRKIRSVCVCARAHVHVFVREGLI